MNTISATMHKSKHARTEHPVLTIDGFPAELWVVDADGLVPAQGWLTDEEHLQSAWKLLAPREECSTVVPILICPDDMDLNCTVVAVEQVVTAQTVIWARFGFARGVINGVVTSVNWSTSEQRAEFERNQFDSAFLEFKRLTEDVWV